jgi:hypothetical protein
MPLLWAPRGLFHISDPTEAYQHSQLELVPSLQTGEDARIISSIFNPDAQHLTPNPATSSSIASPFYLATINCYFLLAYLS